jgi:PadR family transcriptional regulator PadR
MLKKIQTIRSESLIADVDYRRYVESFESELLRGITTIAILQIIKQAGEIHGYEIVQKLAEDTENLLIVNEGTIYPLLRDMASDRRENKILSYREVPVLDKEGNPTKRNRKYYILTEYGYKLLNHMTGFFSKLVESISPMMDFGVTLPEGEFMFCPTCANKIKLDEITKFCEVCGTYIEDL